MIFFFFFFFSSRRRHTRLTCDWSSDVCSSDLALGHVDGLLAGVEAAGVLGAPGLDDHVVALGGEAMGEFGGVPGAAALVGVRRADQGDFHQARERTIRSASRASEARIIPVTKIRIVSLAKCSGCTTRS